MIFPILLVIYEVIVYLSTDMYLPALPSIQQHFLLDTQATQATLTMWFLGSGSCQWLTGPLSDNLGRRPIMLGSMLCFALACLLCSYTENYHIFLLGRFIQGAMIGPIFVAGYAAIHERYPEKQAVKLLAIMGVITLAAPTVGPMAGAAVMHLSKWQDIFLILAGIATALGAGIALVMPETLKEPHSLHLITVAKNYTKALSSFKFVAPILTNCCTFAAMIIWLTMGAFITHAQGFSEHEYGLIQACAFGCFILGNRIIPLAINRMSMALIVLMGLSISTVAGGSVLVLFFMHPSNTMAIIALSTITFGTGMCGPNLQKMALQASDEPTGLKLAIFATLISFSGVIFSLSASWVPENWLNMLLMMLGCILIGIMLHTTWMLRCQK